MKDEIQERFNKLMRGLLSISLKLLIPAFPLVAILLISKYPKTIENTFRSLINGFVWLYSNPISIVIVLVFVALMYVFLPPLLKEMKSKISSKTMTKKAGNKKQTNTENNNATTSKTQAEEVLTEEASAEDIQVEEKVVRAVKSRSAEKYEERSLLTPTEKKFYQYLIKDLEGYDVVVNSKVRLEDILKVVNELRSAGAEAISVNEQRIISTSEIRCAGTTIFINGERVGAPFVIKAIGDPALLESAMLMRGGYVDGLKEWGLRINTTRETDIVIPKYNKTISSKFVTTVIEDTLGNLGNN